MAREIEKKNNHLGYGVWKKLNTVANKIVTQTYTVFLIHHCPASRDECEIKQMAIYIKG